MLACAALSDLQLLASEAENSGFSATDLTEELQMAISETAECAVDARELIEKKLGYVDDYQLLYTTSVSFLFLITPISLFTPVSSGYRSLTVGSENHIPFAFFFIFNFFGMSSLRLLVSLGRRFYSLFRVCAEPFI